ncbi:helix-turn-helix transcriptional regulator [Streptomyces lutosisoli]|uniref:LuxR C-terminal-related transcriptional regulator n=1 Tax=Streptomyces lutosisoli TaxID=2665721 RepID=A0ABW2VTF5_9ACTN
MTCVLRPYDPQILAGLARGQTVRLIAKTTGKPYRTVNSRVYSLIRRAEVPNAARLVDVAYRQGWLARLSPEPRPALSLSGRRAEVLHALAAGLTNGQIARDLGVSERTVEFHVLGLYRTLRARNRSHAVALGHQHGHLLPPATACPPRDRRAATSRRSTPAAQAEYPAARLPA